MISGILKNSVINHHPAEKWFSRKQKHQVGDVWSEHGLLLGIWEHVWDKGLTTWVGEHSCSIVPGYYYRERMWLLLVSHSSFSGWLCPSLLGRDWHSLSGLPAVCRIRSKLPSWPVLHFPLHLSPWSLLLCWHSARGNYLCFLLPIQPEAFLPTAFTRTATSDGEGLPDKNLVFKAQFRNPFFLGASVTLLSSPLESPDIADTSFLWEITELSSTSHTAPRTL